MKTNPQLFAQSGDLIGYFNGVFNPRKKWVMTVLSFFAVCLLYLFSIFYATQAASKTFETDTTLTQDATTADAKTLSIPDDGPLAVAAAKIVTRETKLTASDAAESDVFGSSVSISGDQAIVGAWSKDDDGKKSSGAAYIFARDSGSSIWSQEAKLTASDAEEDDEFGFSVSISGDQAIVGAYMDDDAGFDSGSAYIFTKDSGSSTWSQTAKLTASDAENFDLFGSSVSISGDQAIVGAWRRDEDAGSQSGAAYIFAKDSESSTWSQVVKLTASDAEEDDLFGFSVSISGDYAIVGAVGNNDAGQDSGSAYIFEKDPRSGLWSQVAKLTASDADEGDGFGRSVSISGDQAIVGAWGKDNDGTKGSGAAYIFARDRGTGTWSQMVKLTAPDPVADDQFGVSVFISGDQAIVGSRFDNDHGSAYIFARNSGSGIWSQVVKLTASDADTRDLFGESVSISGDQAIVGTPFDDDAASLSGSVYIYEINQPNITLAFDSGVSSTINEAKSEHRILVKLTLRSSGVLSEAVSVDVIDTGTGAATSDADYVAFTPRTLTFPAGSHDGDTRSIELEILDDGILEGEETIELELVNTQGPALLGSIRNHSVTIVDDDMVLRETKLTASDAASGNEFGSSVSISGERVIVGDPLDDDAGELSGSAYIFERDVSTDRWLQVAKVTASDAAARERFGSSVSISGDHAIVGTFSLNNAGSAYLFERESVNGTWSQVAKLTPSNTEGEDYFGSSVSLSGDRAIVGAKGDDDFGKGSGSAYIFERDIGTGMWLQVAKVTPSDAAAEKEFGSSVALFGNQAIIGAPNTIASGELSGSAYIFERSTSSGTWSQVAKLTPMDPDASNIFGVSVAISGDRAIVGSPFFSESAYIFERDAGSGTWSQVAKISAPDAEGAFYFGSSVALSGDYAIISPFLDLAYIFVRKDGTDEWAQIAKITSSDSSPHDSPVYDVSISGSRAIVGVITFDNSNSGSANIYEIITDIGKQSTLAFDSAMSTIGNEAEAEHQISVKLTVPDGGVLTEAVSVDVIDSGTGTATPDADYVAFIARNLTFPAGSSDGETRPIELEILDDAMVEEDETVKLELGNIQGPALLGSNLDHSATIIDDDSAHLSKIYWACDGKILRADLDGDPDYDGLNEETLLTTDVSGDIILAGDKMMWFNNSRKAVQRANVDGSGVEDLFTAEATLHLRAVDSGEGKLYWTTSNTLQRANLDGSEVEDVFTFEGGFFEEGFADVALDLNDEKVYWIRRGNRIFILRADFFGTQEEELLSSGVSAWSSISLKLDTVRRRMYWAYEFDDANFSASRIHSANLDGSQEKILHEVYADEYGFAYGFVSGEIAVDEINGALYWPSEDDGYLKSIGDSSYSKNTYSPDGFCLNEFTIGNTIPLFQFAETNSIIYDESGISSHQVNIELHLVSEGGAYSGHNRSSYGRGNRNCIPRRRLWGSSNPNYNFSNWICRWRCQEY